MNIYDGKIPDRIRECAKMVGGGNEMARITGIPRRTLECQMTGKSESKASTLIAIAEAAGVTLDWLMLGRGEPSKQTPPLAPLDEEALEAAISLTEEAVKQAGAKLTADKKAKIALFIYKRIADKPENKDVEADLSNVISLVKLAV